MIHTIIHMNGWEKGVRERVSGSFQFQLPKGGDALAHGSDGPAATRGRCLSLPADQRLCAPNWLPTSLLRGKDAARSHLVCVTVTSQVSVLSFNCEFCRNELILKSSQHSFGALRIRFLELEQERPPVALVTFLR